jgi:hypothetical protein
MGEFYDPKKQKRTPKGFKWQAMLDSITQLAVDRANQVLAISSRKGLRGLAAHIAALHVTALVRPRIEYGCSIWGACISVKQMSKLQKIQDDFARSLLDLSTTCNPSFATGELGLPSLHSRLHEQVLRYWGKLCSLPADRLIRHLFDASLKSIRTRKGKFTWVACAQKIIRDLGSPTLNNMTTGKFPPGYGLAGQAQQAQPNLLVSPQRSAWRADVARAVKASEKALYSKAIAENAPLASFKSAPKLDPWLKFSFREGTHLKLVLLGNAPFLNGHAKKVAIAEVHRRKGSFSDPEDDTSCPACRVARPQAEPQLEDREHLLLHCPEYESLRRKCIDDIREKASRLNSSTMVPVLDDWLLALSFQRSRVNPCFLKSRSSDHTTARLAFFLGGPPPEPHVSSPKPRLSVGELTSLLSIIDKSVRLFLSRVLQQRQSCITKLVALLNPRPCRP